MILFACVFISAVILLSFIVVSMVYLGTVSGQDFDPCFVNNDMFQRICEQQEIDEIMNGLLERAREWNDK